MLNLDVFDQVWAVNDNIATQVVTSDGLGWNDLCVRRSYGGICQSTGVLQFFNDNQTYYNENIKTLSDLQVAISSRYFLDGSAVNRAIVFGDYEVDPANDLITSFKGLLSVYAIKDGDEGLAYDWQGKLINTMKYAPQYPAEVYYISKLYLDPIPNPNPNH